MILLEHTGIVISPNDEGPALGRRVTEFEGFDTFEAPKHLERVMLTCDDEFTAICPVTGQRDFYTVLVMYVPGHRHPVCVESKTWKLYLAQFDNQGVFCEALAARIAEDVFDGIAADEVRVTVIQKPRGGTSIKAVAHRVNPEYQAQRRETRENGRGHY